MSLFVAQSGISLPPQAAAQFVTTWNTGNSGTSNSDQITLPLISGGTYSFDVDWGDGNSDTITAHDDAAVTHTYASSGTYTVTITGTIEGWQFAGGGDAAKLTGISEFGPLALNNNSAFEGCSNLSITATDAPTINTTDLSSTFKSGSSLGGADFSAWDMSGVTNLSNFFTFASGVNGVGCGGWDVSSVTDFSGFAANTGDGGPQWTEDISGWDTSSATNMNNMWKSITPDSDLSGWDISGVTQFGDFIGNGFNGLTTAQYDALLDINTGWPSQTVQQNISIDFGISTYTAGGDAETGRNDLINNDGWTITDGGTA